MTPYEIGILMHYVTTRGDYVGRGEPILEPTLEAFIHVGLLRRPGPDDDPHGADLIATERARVYVESLRRVPLPVQHWVTEWPKASIA